METQNQNITLKTYRFILSNNIIEHLSNFAKIHQYDDRKTFKEEWENWISDENIQLLINEEIKHLTNEGFKGDVIDKMFKSARYYYRTKPIEKEENKNQRKTYEHVSKEIQEKMDEHIYRQINQNVQINNNNFSIVSPAESFDNYLLENKDDLIKDLKEKNQSRITKEDCENLIKKYKKTYKNRFYNIRVTMNKNK
jgi:hypothetical protein